MSGLDIDALHCILWYRAGRSGQVRIKQVDLAEELMVRKHTLNRKLRAMEDEGRIWSLSPSRGATVQTYVVTDPRDWFTMPAAMDLEAPSQPNR